MCNSTTLTSSFLRPFGAEVLCCTPGLWQEVEPVALLSVLLTPPTASSARALLLLHLNEEKSRLAERGENHHEEESTAVIMEDHFTLRAETQRIVSLLRSEKKIIYNEGKIRNLFDT